MMTTASPDDGLEGSDFFGPFVLRGLFRVVPAACGRPASMTTSFDDAAKPQKTPLPHLNFACNSPTTLSNFEIGSLKFRGFLDVVNLSDDRIACEIGESSGSMSVLRQVMSVLRQVLRRSHNSYSQSPTTPSLCPSQTQVAQTPHPHDLRRTSIPPVRTSPVD